MIKESIEFFIGCMFGLIIGLFIGYFRIKILYSEYEEILKKMQKQERINKKLIHFIRFKLDDCIYRLKRKAEHEEN